MSKNIILIDTRVKDYETIVAAVDTALAVSVVFDYFEDTFDTLKERIGALGTNTNSVSVGLIQHNYRTPMFSMLASADVAPVLSVAVQDPDLTQWAQFRDFITWCKTEYNAAHFDMMACALYSNSDWKYIIDTLTVKTGVIIRASTDDTGAAALGGDWFLESHTGVNLKTVYFAEAIEEYRGILYLYSYDIREYYTKSVATGSIVAWGSPTLGGTTPENVSSDVVGVYSTEDTFAALKTDGSVVTWGDPYNYGSKNAPSSVTAANSGVIDIASNNRSFAALKTNGSIVAWGQPDLGGTTPANVSSGVVAVYSNITSFAALKSDGSIVAWGSSSSGGTTPANVSSGVVAVYSAYIAFAALKTDGSVVAWGQPDYGGITPANVSSGVVVVYSNLYAFAALKNDGSVITWGDSSSGGNSSSVSSSLTSGVVAVYPSGTAFAGLKSNGSVVAWGNSSNGGSAPSSVTAANSGVVTVYSTQTAFAALKTDGSVVAWGNSSYGGNAPSSVTAANSGVVAVYSTQYAFAALKTDGSVVAWGDSTHGGVTPNNVSSGVVAINANVYAFAALKTDGSVVSWGHPAFIAPNSITAANSGVVATYGTHLAAFATLKTTATTFDLSMSYYTDANRYNILRKKENRRRVNLTTLNNNVFTLSAQRDIQSFNPTMPTNIILRIIIPTYVSSPHAITSTATIPSGAGNVIIACDDGEPVTISGTTYVNYGSYVYKRETNNTYTKTTSATINDVQYTLYGGDGIYSSGIALVEAPKPVPVLSTFIVESSKTFGDASFAITTRPTSDSTGAITYSSSNTAVATIDASGNWITLVAAGDVYFNASQVQTNQYNAASITSNTLTVARGTSTLSSSTFTVASSKTYGDASFAITTLPTSNSDGAITYSSSNTAVATIDASGNFITLVGAGDVSFNSTQAQTNQYNSATVTSNTLTVARGTSTLSSATFSVASSKTFGDASFAITTQPTSNSDGAITYSSSNTAVATIDASGNWITLVGAGDVSFNATQAQTNQYNSATITSNTLTVARGTSTLSSSVPATSYMVACDEGEHVTISGTTYVNYGTFVYQVNANGTYTKVTSATINGVTYNLYGGDGINSSGIVFISDSSTFIVASSKTFGDASFAITTRPTSNNTTVPIVYSSSNTSVATIDASGNFITIVGAGDVSFNATQAQTSQYNSATITSNTLTVSKATPTLAFVSPPTTKNLTDAAFTVVASSASSGVITYSSSNVSLATVGASTGLVTLKAAGTVTITASQAASAQYNAPTNTTCSIVISAAADGLAGQTVPPGTSFADLNLSGASLVGTTVSGVSFSGANLSNVNFSGAVITGTDFTNANISGATNLPTFSTVQKLQLLKNINNVGISAVQVATTVSGSEINALLSTPNSTVAAATFTVKPPTSLDGSANKVITISSVDISGGKSIYIPMNANETVKINNIVYSFNGTNILDTSGNPVTYITFINTPFKIYAGSIVAVNIEDALNKISILGDGLYDMLSSIFSTMFAAKT